MPNPLAIANIGGGLLKAGIGYFQNRKGNKLLKKLQYPTQVIPSAIRENKKQAEIDAATGLPQEQYNKAMKNIQRNQLAKLRVGMDRNSGISLISSLADIENDAIGDLDAADAQARILNKRNLQGVNNTYGNWQNQVWQNNVKDKYDRDYDYAMSLKGQGGSNLASGADSILAGTGYGLAGGFRKSGTRKRTATSNNEPDTTNWNEYSNSGSAPI